MGSRLMVEICMNPDVIRTLYDDEFVQNRYADSAYYGFIDAPNVFYLASRDSDGWLCCALCVFRSTWDIEVHLCIPGAQRARGYEFAESVIEWLFSNAPINRISTTVVSIFPQVANFARRLGFKQEGTARGACLRDDEFIDLWLFSLLRGEDYGRRR